MHVCFLTFLLNRNLITVSAIHHDDNDNFHVTTVTPPGYVRCTTTITDTNNMNDAYHDDVRRVQRNNNDIRRVQRHNDPVQRVQRNKNDRSTTLMTTTRSNGNPPTRGVVYDE
ncbi:hypothetical protein BYT27DRAFT_7238892 [Phlegmacium glaucopus]|nr:hypothetical protein BYT27DRAFT_7238892 [Phlegmacium glaucopus]